MENTTKLSSKEILQKLYFKGEPFQLCVEKSPFGFSRIHVKENQIKVQFPAFKWNNESDFSATVYSWFRNQAKAEFGRQIENLKQKYAFNFNRIVIKDTVSRWGSCSSKGNLNFNWRLIMAPAPVLNYIAIHETAHLEELNHSKRFWNLVAQRCPNYQTYQEWLKKNGANLLNWKLAPISLLN